MQHFQLNGQTVYSAQFFDIKEKQTKEIRSTHPSIIFIKEADVRIFFSSEKEKVIQKGQFFLLPQEFPCQLESSIEQSLLIIQIPDITYLYIHYFSHFPQAKVNGFSGLFAPLSINHLIERVMKDITLYIERGLLDNALIQLKTFELFYLIKQSFSKEYIMNFFTPVFSEGYEFALFVWSNYTKVKTAEELSLLSNYTFSGFEKQFRKVFGIAPYKWMLQKKIDKVYREIYHTNKPIKVIAEENGFATLSNLGDFCRKHMGYSPLFIRKKRIL